MGLQCWLQTGKGCTPGTGAQTPPYCHYPLAQDSFASSLQLTAAARHVGQVPEQTSEQVSQISQLDMVARLQHTACQMSP